MCSSERTRYSRCSFNDSGRARSLIFSNRASIVRRFTMSRRPETGYRNCILRLNPGFSRMVRFCNISRSPSCVSRCKSLVTVSRDTDV